MNVEPMSGDITFAVAVIAAFCVSIFLLGVLVGLHIGRREAHVAVQVTSDRDEARLDEQIAEMSRKYLRRCRRHRS